MGRLARLSLLWILGFLVYGQPALSAVVLPHVTVTTTGPLNSGPGSPGPFWST